MALDFPSNPVDGQVYDNFYYDAEMGTWRAYGTVNLQVPAGIISQYAGTSAPSGYLLCTGQSLSTAEYPALFQAIGYTYGGSAATFNLPNLQNRVPVGRGTDPEFDTLGETGGTKSTSLTSANIPEHSHSINHDHPSFTTGSDGGHVHTYFMDDGASIYGGATRVQAIQYDATSGASGNGGQFNTGGTGNHSHTIDVPNFTGTSGNYGSSSVTPVSAIQPYIVLNYIIKT